MAKPGERVVGRTCTYVRADGRYVPALITALTTDVDLEVYPLDGADTYSNVLEMTAPSDTDVWLPGSRYRY
jgi:hypothetical protein